MARQRVPPGPQAAPAVQRLRLRYAKRGRLRFSSTRDFQRALERALRRADVPMAYSSGFHPHPKISYANAAPTGVASEAEYVELALVARVDLEALREALDAALPPGLDVLEVVEAQGGSLADSLQASVWRCAFPGTDVAALRQAREVFLGLDAAEVERVLKSGPRALDARAAVVSMEVSGADPSLGAPDQGGERAARAAGREGPAECAILHMVVRHTTPAVRPDDIFTALRMYAALTDASPPVVTRLAQGPLLEGSATVADPLATATEVIGVAAVPRVREPTVT